MLWREAPLPPLEGEVAERSEVGGVCTLSEWLVEWQKRKVTPPWLPPGETKSRNRKLAPFNGRLNPVRLRADSIRPHRTFPHSPRSALSGGTAAHPNIKIPVRYSHVR